ncbi:MAG: hypothetical protein HKN36_07815 [Hellea sp.]|nr:hypothetical protein [Hellea sp.]
MRVFMIMPLALISVNIANADEGELRQLIECNPAKDLVKTANALTDLDADKVDTIKSDLAFTLAPNDGGVLPERIFWRLGDAEKDLPFSEDGEVTNFIDVFAGDKSAEICVEDPTRTGQPKDEKPFAMSVNFQWNYRNSSGTYQLTELEDGLKDAKSTLKKLAGAPASLMVPSFTHVAIGFDDKEAEAEFRAFAGETDLGQVATERLGPAYIFEYDQLEDMGADRLIVEGGAHKLMPSLSPEKMGGGDDDKEE